MAAHFPYRHAITGARENLQSINASGYTTPSGTDSIDDEPEMDTLVVLSDEQAVRILV